MPPKDENTGDREQTNETATLTLATTKERVV